MAKATASTTATGYCMKCKTHARNHESQADYDEEWSASDRRHLPGVQHQDVQDRRHQVSLRE